MGKLTKTCNESEGKTLVPWFKKNTLSFELIVSKCVYLKHQYAKERELQYIIITYCIVWTRKVYYIFGVTKMLNKSHDHGIPIMYEHDKRFLHCHINGVYYDMNISIPFDLALQDKEF